MASQLQTVSESRLQRLPAELKKHIMVNLDVLSFYALATTCQAFYNTYKCDNGITLCNIVANALGSNFPLAIALQAAIRSDLTPLLSKIPRDAYLDRILDEIHQFGRKYLDPTNQQIPRPEDFSLSFAWEIMSFHSIVEELARKFIEVILIRELDQRWDIRPRPPTDTEVARVQAAFYYLEISRELLPLEGTSAELRNMLWHYAPPWDAVTAGKVTSFLEEYVDAFTEIEIPRLNATRLTPNKALRRWNPKLGLRAIDKLANGEFKPKFVYLIAPAEADSSPAAYFVPTDRWGLTWLRPVAQGFGCRSLNIDHILARFPLEDRGPFFNWYYNVVVDHGHDLIPRLQSRPEETAWWDVARIREAFDVSGNTCSVEGMEYIAKGKVIRGEFTIDPIDFCKECGY
ncbi:hypothetical protein F4811DRAFT_524799 [Daldinia bambusicola]|nr:hypothetical protein F4811DRAFT_524799 [Daldinia bambusicola]